MVKIIFIDQQGHERVVEGRAGQSLMLVAVQNEIAGIDGECGGACACATCHVLIDPEWSSKLPKAEMMEQDMLDFARDVQANSRLACQIKLTPEIDGMSVRVGKN
jgi:2Fe-2S ferredoxin